MKTSHLLSAALAVGLGFSLTAARAINVSEAGSGDFANDAASAATYVLDLGANGFSGAIGGGDDDFFKVTVLPGRKVTVIGTSGAAGTSQTAPLYAGTYTFFHISPVLPGNEAWGFTFTVVAAPDYEVTVGSGQMVVTDRSGNGDTLTVSEPFAGTIRFAAPGRTFSLNGAAFTNGDSGSISHAGISGIAMNAGAGSDTIAVGAFTSQLPSLTINGGTGDDTVNFTGDLTFAISHDLDIDLQNDAASPGVDSVNVAANANLATSGSGRITVRCSRNVSLASGASLTTARGPLTVEANQQEPATTGNFVGVNLSGATLSCLGDPFIPIALTVKGRGGNDAGGSQLGVHLDSGAIITGGLEVNVEVTGTGGAGTGGVNRGVTLNGAGAVIESTSENGGSVNVTGTGGPASNNFGIGVSLLGGSIRAAATGFADAPVTVTGTGAGAPGTSVNQGVEIGGGSILADRGDLVVRGTAGPGASVGIYMDGAQGMFTNSGGGNITLRADSLSFLGTAAIGTPNPVSKVTIGQRNGFSGPIDLGGADPAAGKLSLTDAVLDRITTEHLVIGVDSTTAIGTSAEVGPGGASVVTLYAAAVQPSFTGTDVTLAATRSLRVAGPLVIPITGAAANTSPGYPQLKVAGQVDLSLATLALTGTTFAGVAGNTFTLVENDGTDTIFGAFAGLSEGAIFAWPGSPLLKARISYVGGSGNDVVLTLVNPLEVTNTDYSGFGSLSDALTYAATLAGANTITFHPSLSGATTHINSYQVNDPGGVTLDASALPGGFTFDGDTDDQIFSHAAGSSLTLRRLTLTRGSSSTGGAIINNGTLTLEQCTLSGNRAGAGGAIFNQGALTLTGCTLRDNEADINPGGAVFTVGPATFTRCTFSGNRATGPFGSGGAIFQEYEAFAVTLTHCTLVGNSCNFSYGGAIARDEESDALTLNYCLVAANPANGDPAANISGFVTTNQSLVIDTANLLSPIGDYGGPTQTIALLPTHPAREAATTSTSTSDQRGLPIIGQRDIGAYEAGTPRNYAAWKYDTLPATATLAQRAPGFDYDGDGRLNVLEYATFTDGAVPGGSTGTTFVRLPGGSEARFTFTVNAFATDLLYELQRSLPGVGPWVTIGDVNLRTGLLHNYGVGVTNVPSLFSIEFRDPAIAGQAKAFYRLQVSVP